MQTYSIKRLRMNTRMHYNDDGNNYTTITTTTKLHTENKHVTVTMTIAATTTPCPQKSDRLNQ